MDSTGCKDRVRAWFVEFSADILCRNIAVVTGEAVLFLVGECQQALARAGVVWCVTVFTAVGGDGGLARVWPRIDTKAIPCLA